MNHIYRSLAAVAALGLATAAAATGPAAGADLLQAPTGAAAGDPGAWTPVVARSYQQHYADVQCLTLPAPSASEATYDLGAAPSGEWFFAVVATPTRTYQYGPAEFTGTRVPAGAGSTGVIGCHGTPVPTDGDAGSRRAAAAGIDDTSGGTVDEGTDTPLALPDEESTPPTTPVSSASSAPMVPAQIASGLEGGGSGLVVLGVGAVLVAGLALLGRRARP